MYVDLRPGNIFLFIDQQICFSPISCGFDYYSSVVQYEIGNGGTSRNSFIVQDCFGYPAFFYEFEKYPFKVYKEFCWNFDVDFIESVYCFW